MELPRKTTELAVEEVFGGFPSPAGEGAGRFACGILRVEPSQAGRLCLVKWRRSISNAL